MKIPILPEDKANHFVYGAVICVVVQLLVRLALDASALQSILAAMLAVIVVAVLKEASDDRARASHTPEWMDFLATVAGGALAVMPALIA